MINKYTHKTITWLDIENPTPEEIRSIITEYSIDPSIAKDLHLPTYKEKIEMHDNYIYLVMHFPSIRHSHSGENKEQEVDFLISKNFIITTRYETIDAFESFQKLFEVNSILDKGIMEDHCGFVFYYIMKELYKTVSDEADSLNDSIKEVDGQVFKGKEKEMVSVISNLNRDLLHLNHTTRTHEEIFEALPEMAIKIFGKDFSENCDKLSNEYFRVQGLLNHSIDFLKEIRDTNDSLLNTKQNEIMKTLTIITFLALPFGIITGLFQMNTTNTPLVGAHNDWGIVVGVELLAMIILFIVAKTKKWL